jgi:hypothetical protein
VVPAFVGAGSAGYTVADREYERDALLGQDSRPSSNPPSTSTVVPVM